MHWALANCKDLCGFHTFLDTKMSVREEGMESRNGVYLFQLLHINISLVIAEMYLVDKMAMSDFDKNDQLNLFPEETMFKWKVKPTPNIVWLTELFAPARGLSIKVFFQAKHLHNSLQCGLSITVDKPWV